MNVDDVVARLPDIAWPEVPSNVLWSQIRERWPLLRQSCEAAVTRVAKSALGASELSVMRPLEFPEPAILALGIGAPAPMLASDQIVPRIAKAFADIYMVFGEGGRGSERDSARWAGLLAIVAGVFGEWDLVATMTGGALPLGVTGDPEFRNNTQLLARHLAVVARTRATKHAAACMAEQRRAIALAMARPREGFDIEICTALCAARLYFAHAVQVPSVPDAVRGWLAGEPLAHETDPHAAQIADVRTTIFERYLPELSDAKAHAMARRLLAQDARSAAIDSAAVYLFVAREADPDLAHVDPLIAELLGADVGLAAKRAALVDLKVRARHFRAVSNIPLAVPANLAHALVTNDEPAILMITGRGTLAPFRPNQIFGDDFRPLGRYLLAAKKAGATAADVTPAWLDFLARRSPRTSRLELTWRDLLLYQRIVTVDIGGDPPRATAAALRRSITGQP